jgi:hypothetical protein
MPRTAIDYSKNVIYKIVCNDLTITELYVGSTTDFIRRKNEHKNTCINSNNKNTNLKIYQIIRNNGNWENWTMIQIEEYPCTNGNEARARERYWFEQLNAMLNTQHPNRSKKEYGKEFYKNNKDKINEYNKTNTDKIKERRQKWYESNKDKIAYQKKEQYELNKDTICKNAKEYAELNKDKIKEYRAQLYMCECGATFKKSNMYNHKNTKKHINYLNLQKENI